MQPTTATAEAKSGNWQRGPLPPGTWNWGGVVLKGMTAGFLFADFCGDHVKVDGHRRDADEVIWWNNSLDLPPVS